MGSSKSKAVAPVISKAPVEETFIPQQIPPQGDKTPFDYLNSLQSVESAGGPREANIEDILLKVEEGVKQAEAAQMHVHNMADHVREFGIEVSRLCPFVFRAQRRAETGHLSKLEPPGPSMPTDKSTVGKDQIHPGGAKPDMAALFGDYAQECRLLADEIGQAADRARMAAGTLRQAELKGKRAANGAIQALMNPTMPLEPGKFHAELREDTGDEPPPDRGETCHMACTSQRKSVTWPYPPNDPVGHQAHDVQSEEQGGEQKEFEIASKVLSRDAFRPEKGEAQVTGHTLQERLGGSGGAPFHYQTQMRPVKLRASAGAFLDVSVGQFL